LTANRLAQQGSNAVAQRLYPLKAQSVGQIMYAPLPAHFLKGNATPSSVLALSNAWLGALPRPPVATAVAVDRMKQPQPCSPAAHELDAQQKAEAQQHARSAVRQTVAHARSAPRGESHATTHRGGGGDGSGGDDGGGSDGDGDADALASPARRDVAPFLRPLPRPVPPSTIRILADHHKKPRPLFCARCEVLIAWTSNAIRDGVARAFVVCACGTPTSIDFSSTPRADRGGR